MKNIKAVLAIFLFLSFAVLLSATASAANPARAIDTSGKVKVYENTFDTDDALKDFKSFNGTWGIVDGRAKLLSYTNGNMNTFTIYNGDGKTDTADALLILDTVLNGGYSIRMDKNFDGRITLLDAMYVIRALVD